MPTPSSAAIIAASRDSDLVDRAVALGATLGLSQVDVELAKTRLVTVDADQSGLTIASVHEYAKTQREQKVKELPPAPGADPSAVTDAHLLYALGKIRDEMNPSA